MTAFKKTILGKILGGAAKVVAAVGSVVVGGVVAKAVVGGIGSLLNAHPNDDNPAGGLDVIAEKAKAFVNGLTPDQQKVLDAEKADAKTAAQKLKLANKLINLGASQADAYSKAGITGDEAANVVNTEDNSDLNPANKTSFATFFAGPGKWVLAVIAALLLVPKLLKHR
jgi:hypothetical protein